MTEFKKLSIVFITNNWHPFNAGVVSSINAYRQELLGQGHSVHLIALDFDGTQEQNVIKLFCPIKFMYKGVPLAIPLMATVQIWRIISKINPDIVHCHHPFLLGVAGLTVARLKKIPCVFTYHSLYEKYTHYAPCAQAWVQKAVRKRVAWFCKKVGGIITPGQETVRLLERDGVTTPHILLPSPVQETYLMQEVVRTPKTNVHQPLHIMTCSRFVKEKNIPFLLEMFAKLDQTRFKCTLAGFGSEFEVLKKYAYETLQLSPDVVHFAVNVSTDSLKELYAQADVFVFASLADTQGLVLAEAMASGLPVVALQGPGQEDIVRNGVNGYLVHSQEEMCAALTIIAGDAQLFNQLSTQAIATAQQYAATPLTHKLVAFYKSL